MDSSAGSPPLNPASPVRIFVINDSPIFLEALRRFFVPETWIEQVGSALLTADVYPEVFDTQPQVIVIDPGRRRSTLADIVAKLRAQVPGVAVIVLTMEPGGQTQPLLVDVDEVSRAAAIEAGADAFVAKERAAEDLLDAVRRVAGRRPV